MQVYKKDPSAVLDYALDWSEWLGVDTIATSDWTVPAGLVEEAASNTTTTATVWLSGGTVGTTYLVTNRVVTAGGRTDERSFRVYVTER